MFKGFKSCACICLHAYMCVCACATVCFLHPNSLSLSLYLSLSHGFLPPWPGFMLKMPQCCNYRNFVRVVSLVCALRMAPKKMPHKTREMLFNRGAYKYKITCMIHVCTYRERERVQYNTVTNRTMSSAWSLQQHYVEGG